MVAVRVSRQSAEVLAQTDQPISLTRVDVEVAGLAQAANATDVVRVSRMSAEVLAKAPTSAAVSRIDVELAGLAQQANAVDPVRVSRMSAEVLASISPHAALTRLDVELAGLAQAANAVDPVRVSRITAEALARRGSAGAVVPLALGADNEVFMHDWADQCVLRSSYLTDISRSASTGAESRRGNRLKPARSMDIVWRQSEAEFAADSSSRLDRLYVFLRRLTDQRVAVPLYPDQRVLDAAYGSGDDTLLFDTSRGRWFVGARVAVVQFNHSGQYASHTFHFIEDMDDSQLVLTAPLGVAVLAQSVVIPMIDCEITLEAEMLQERGCLAEVTITVDEVPGASQLPPTKADTPTDTPTHLGVPILDVDPDWSAGVRRRRSRQGNEFNSGRGRGVSAQADRSREVHELIFVNARGCGEGGALQDAHKLIEFFDTRRGRLRSFWHIDQEHIHRAAVVSTGSVQIDPLGDIDDFREELVGGQLGLVMSDGSFYVRGVSAVNAGVTWDAILSPVLPSGLDADDVVRVTRARRVRFDSDEMEETWTNAGLVEVKFRIIEVLNEGDVAVG